MTELQSHSDPHRLTLAEHLQQIRQAARAIWGRHSRELLSRCAVAIGWFEDAVCLHDAGKASRAFQQYISAPNRYRGPKDRKAHTPLSTVLTLLHGHKANWDWRRTLAVALVAAGHHSEFKTHEELDDGLASMDAVIHDQIKDLNWDALDRAVGLVLPRLSGKEGLDVVCDASECLSALTQELHGLSIPEGFSYRLLTQLTFSVLLEADKAFLAVPEKDLPQYLAPRTAVLPARRVEEYAAGKPTTSMSDTRRQARSAMSAGLEGAGEFRVHTMTLPTGTGKTLLAASWALTLRQRSTEAASPPLVLVVLPFLAVIDQTAEEYRNLFRGLVQGGELITYHSLSDRTFADDLEDQSQDFFLDTWQSDVVITTFDQFLFALLSPKGRHQIRFHHLADALIVMDEVQALPCILWDPVRRALDGLTRMGTTQVLAMSATQPGFLPEARELIDRPGDFFKQMKRYRLVLRHQNPLPLSAFIEECQRRLTEDWKGQRVLLTLNTRRSAKALRDALAPLAKEINLPLEFISADLTPTDRLAAIRRIKAGSPCLVVSTQCIEAGVDIDMDFVVRDFAPLDSLIQVAGRCNRNASNHRSSVEIVSLLDDTCTASGGDAWNLRLLASYVYDVIQLDVTRNVLGNRPTVDEEDVFPLTQAYFSALSAKKDLGDSISQALVRWEDPGDSVRTLLRGAATPQTTFLVISQDPDLRKELDEAKDKPDRWERRRALRRLAGRVARITVTVRHRTNLDPENYADPYPLGSDHEAAWFWLLKGQFYAPERGIDVGQPEHADDAWGVIV